MSILICEDDEPILEVLTMVISDLGFRALPANSITKFRQIMREQKPRLILIDYWIGDTRADTLIEEVRGNPDYAQIPIVLISAMNNLQQLSKKLDVDDFISKPFEIDDLEAKINKLTATTYAKSMHH